MMSKRIRNTFILLALVLLGAVSVYAFTLASQPHPPSVPRVSDRALLVLAYQKAPAKESPLVPLPESLPLNAKEVALGQRLFFDPRLSADNSIACATCHQLKHAGADPRPVSLGIQGQKGELNAPPVFNAVFNFAQFWDGRAKDLQEQAEGPLLNPVEMGMPDWPTLLKKLNAIPTYQHAFQTLYPEQGLTKDTLTYTIAQFERSLISPNSPFDRYLKGDLKALSTQARQGYQLFKSKGCIACHNGINIGGNLFQKAGVYEPLIKQNQAHRWLGRFNVTHRPEDKLYLKVPSLRNVALTAPYFHDGQITTLKQAIKAMGDAQLGQSLTDLEILKIEAFLHSLTGEYLGVPLNEL